MEAIIRSKNAGFIEANTTSVSKSYLEEQTIIPVFAKDNESTISHTEFIEAVEAAVWSYFGEGEVEETSIRVSHPIKGRIPEAKGKAVSELLSHEKTIYYERMAFLIEVPSIQAELGDSRLSLSIGGVRAYNHENLYNSKGLEKFKVFIGFKNWVCTNLCVSTNGLLDTLKVLSSKEICERTLQLCGDFSIESELESLKQLQEYSISHNQFSHFIGRAKQSLNMPKEECATGNFPLGESQLSTMVRMYYDQGMYKQTDLNLWQLYNLMTDANKSSYIDSFLNRSVSCLDLCLDLGNSLKNGDRNWFLI